AWNLPKQDATKPVEQNTAAAGRNAERSAADSTSTTTPAPGGAPTVAAPPAQNDTGAEGGGGGAPVRREPPKPLPAAQTAKDSQPRARPPPPVEAARAPDMTASSTNDTTKTEVRTRGATKGDAKLGQGAAKPDPLADKGPTGKSAHDVLADAS